MKINEMKYCNVTEEMWLLRIRWTMCRHVRPTSTSPAYLEIFQPLQRQLFQIAAVWKVQRWAPERPNVKN